MKHNASERWKSLQSTVCGDTELGVHTLDSGITTGYGTVRFALGDSGEPRFLVPVSAPTASATHKINSTQKLTLSIVKYDVRGKSTPFIDIISNDRALDKVFAELCEEMLRRIDEGESPWGAVQGAIEDFRELLRESSHEVSSSAILGVVGEMRLLLQLIKVRKTAIDTWTGPLNQRHDFRAGNDALEVKTSGRSDTKTVSIHGSDQLEAPEGGCLLLVHQRLEQTGNGDLSVARLFEDLVTTGAGKSKLSDRLDAVGCPDPMADNWNRLSFSLEGVDGYKVEMGFPRLIAADLKTGSMPKGVMKLSYQIDLQHASEFRLDPRELDEHLRLFAQ